MAEPRDADLIQQLRAYGRVLDAVPDRPSTGLGRDSALPMARVAVGRRRARRTGGWAAAIAVLVVFGAVAVVVLARGTDVDHGHGNRQAERTEHALGAGTPFVPPTRQVGAQTVMSLTLLNGDTIDLQYPTALHLEQLGFAPAIAIDWHPTGSPADCCSRTPEIRHGTIAQVFAGRAPTKTYAGRDGGVVEYFTGSTANHLAFQVGDWVVAVPDYEGTRFAASNPPMTDQQRATYAAKLSGHETADGSLVLTTSAPLTLARTKYDADLGDGRVIIIYRACDTKARVPAGTHGFTVDASSPSTGTWLCYDRIPIVVHITGTRSFQHQLSEGLQIPANHQSAYG